MSGLLVKSTVVMRENLQEMSRLGSISRCCSGVLPLRGNMSKRNASKAYASAAWPMRATPSTAASDGQGGEGNFDGYGRRHRGQTRRKPVKKPARVRGEPAATAAAAAPDRARGDQAAPRRARPGRRRADAALLGPASSRAVPVKSLVAYLNERMLFQFHWGFRKDGRRLDEYMEWARRELRPELKRMLDVCCSKTSSSRGRVRLLALRGGRQRRLLSTATDARRRAFPFRARRARTGSASPISSATARPQSADVIGLQLVTIGQRASDVARDWFADNRYQDYLYLHGLGVEMAEALAEYVHKRIRAELGFAAEDAREMDKLLQQGYRGSRYSFGYPACPRLEDQTQLLALLGADQIGVTLSEEFQLNPSNPPRRSSASPTGEIFTM